MVTVVSVFVVFSVMKLVKYPASWPVYKRCIFTDEIKVIYLKLADLQAHNVMRSELHTCTFMYIY